MPRTIWFKKQQAGQWYRESNIGKNPVSDKEMRDEILKLGRSGCSVKIWKINHAYTIEVTIP